MDTTNSSEKPQPRVKHGQRPTEPLADWPAEFGAAGAEQPAATSGDAPADGWPSEIYLNAGDDPLGHFDEYADVSWCDHPQGENDVRYVRAELSRIERTTAHVQPVNTSSERVENAAGNEQVECAAAPAPTAPFAWMKSNEINGLLDAVDKATHQGEPVRQYGRIYARQYDADMVPVYTAHPATASGDELPPLPSLPAPTRLHYGLHYRPEDMEAYGRDCARAAVSAATKPTAREKHMEAVAHAAAMDMVRIHEALGLPADDEVDAERIIAHLLATKPAAAQALPGCLADRLYEAISIAHDRASHAGSTPRMKKWADTAADLSAALAAATPAASTIGAAQTAEGAGQAGQVAMTADELAALRRFYECAADGEGYDVPKPMMRRLSEIGVVQRISGAYYHTTEYGLAVLESAERAAAPADQPSAQVKP